MLCYAVEFVLLRTDFAVEDFVYETLQFTSYFAPAVVYVHIITVYFEHRSLLSFASTFLRSFYLLFVY